MPKKKTTVHPSGPGLPGHPGCPRGQIFDHSAGKCISLLAARKKSFRKGSVKSSVKGIWG